MGEKLSRSIKLIYGAGDLGFSLTSTIIGAYFLPNGCVVHQICLGRRGYTGWPHLFTPRVVPRLGYCSYNCEACLRACPTGAILPLDKTQKQRTLIGLPASTQTAVFRRRITRFAAYAKRCAYYRKKLSRWRSWRSSRRMEDVRPSSVRVCCASAYSAAEYVRTTAR